jgi:pimeloyl-ACP methyl ester carboxylesterase
MAPDLIGHGMAHASTDYSIKAFADALLPLLSSSPPFDLIVGHSLGALITIALLPNFRFSGRGRVVLVDPPLEIGAGEPLQMIRKACVDQVLNIKSLHECITQMNWTETDAAWSILGWQLCKPKVVNTFFDVSLHLNIRTEIHDVIV